MTLLIGAWTIGLILSQLAPRGEPGPQLELFAGS